MNQHDEKWEGLLRRASATFEADAVPPYGFVTRTLAQLNSERRQQAEAERIGWRALWASFAALVIAAAVSFAVTYPDQANDFDPGVRSLLAADNVSIS